MSFHFDHILRQYFLNILVTFLLDVGFFFLSIITFLYLANSIHIILSIFYLSFELCLSFMNGISIFYL